MENARRYWEISNRFYTGKNRQIRGVSNCKTLPGADVNTDHNLLISIHNMEVRKSGRKCKPKSIDLNKLKEYSNNKVQYSNKLGYKIEQYKSNLKFDNVEDIEERWNGIKDIIRKTAEENLEKEKIVP